MLHIEKLSNYPERPLNFKIFTDQRTKWLLLRSSTFSICSFCKSGKKKNQYCEENISMYLSGLWAAENFVYFASWLKNVQSRKIYIFSNEPFWNLITRKQTTTFSEENYLQYTHTHNPIQTKTPLLDVAFIFFIKQGEKWTSSGPITFPLNCLNCVWLDGTNLFTSYKNLWGHNFKHFAHML